MAAVDVSSYGVAPIANPVDAFSRAFSAAQENNLRQQQIASNQALEQERRQKLSKEAEAEADQQKFYAILSKPGQTPETAAEEIRTTVPSLYQPYLKQRADLDAKAGEINKAKGEAQKLQAEIATKGQEYAAPFLQLVEKANYNPDTFAFALNTIKGHFADFPAEQMLQQAGGDPAKIKQVIDGFKSPQQQTADTGSARLTAEKPKLDADAIVAQRVAAGTSPTGVTAAQAANIGIAARNAATEAGRLREEQRRNAATEAAADPTNPKRQQALEQQYRGVLGRVLSSRSGGLGLEDQKVNQAIHLTALMDQGKDPKTGQYNIPKAQFAELASGLATLVSPNGRPTDSMREEIETKTAQGDFNGVLTYLTGTPFNGSTQDMYKMLRDSIERQGSVAESNREGYFNAIRAQAPTDLEDSRRQKLEESLKLNSLGKKTQAGPAAAVPPAVSDALKGQKDGHYTLSDGSKWTVSGGVVSGG